MSLSVCYEVIGRRAARGRALLRLSPVCVSAACFSLCGRGPGGGRRRVDLNVFGSSVLYSGIGSRSCPGGTFSRAQCADWPPSWSPPSVSRSNLGLGAGRWRASGRPLRPRGYGGAGPREAPATAFSARAPRGPLRPGLGSPVGVSEWGVPVSGLRVGGRVLSAWSPADVAAAGSLAGTALE